MNAYMYLLVQKYNKDSTKKAVCIDSYEMSDIWKHKKAKVRVSTTLFENCNINVINIDVTHVVIYIQTSVVYYIIQQTIEVM